MLTHLSYPDVSRATPLPPDERRRALLDATVPLLREHGLSTSTRQIAEAAGVAEGTIFRVFASKADLVEAAVSDAVSPDRLIERLGDAAASATGLPALVGALVAILQEHTRDAHLLLALLGRGPHHAHAHAEGTECRRPDLGAISARLASALSALLAPHAAALSVTPASAAAGVLAMSFGSSFGAFAGGAPLPPDQVSGLLLHGLAKEN